MTSMASSCTPSKHKVPMISGEFWMARASDIQPWPSATGDGADAEAEGARCSSRGRGGSEHGEVEGRRGEHTRLDRVEDVDGEVARARRREFRT